MKMASLFNRVLGFYPHTGQHFGESGRSATGTSTPSAAHEPIHVFRGLRCPQGQTAAPATQAYAHALRVFRGWPTSYSSATSGLDASRRDHAVRVFRGRVVR
jgi:hypothetical protein